MDKAKYRVTGFNYFRNKHNAKFVVGMIITGPRGGIYELDEFCAGILIRNVYWKKRYKGADYPDLLNYGLNLSGSGKLENHQVDALGGGTNDYQFATGTKHTFRRKPGLAELEKKDLNGTSLMDKFVNDLEAF